MINIKQTLGSLLVIGKRVLRIIMLYPLFQNGFTGSVEAVKFIQEVTGQEDISISGEPPVVDNGSSRVASELAISSCHRR